MSVLGVAAGAWRAARPRRASPVARPPPRHRVWGAPLPAWPPVGRWRCPRCFFHPPAGADAANGAGAAAPRRSSRGPPAMAARGGAVSTPPSVAGGWPLGPPSAAAGLVHAASCRVVAAVGSGGARRRGRSPLARRPPHGVPAADGAAAGRPAPASRLCAAAANRALGRQRW